MEVDGKIHKIVVGSEIADLNRTMVFQIGYQYARKTLEIVEIEQKFIEGKKWFYIYVIKTQDNDGVRYLWDKITNDNILVQYDLSIHEL